MELPELFRRLGRTYGPQDWWPGESPFEVVVGAVLTHNTAWTNVEMALSQLKARDALRPEIIARMEHDELAALIRSSGYYNVKAGRLQNLCRWFLEAGGMDALAARGTGSLRRGLLGVKGVGPETADAVLAYAFRRPRFVVDAYALRILSRVGIVAADASYDVVYGQVEPHARGNAQLLGEWHALLVAHGKSACRKQPECGNCCLQAGCEFASARL